MQARAARSSVLVEAFARALVSNRDVAAAFNVDERVIRNVLRTVDPEPFDVADLDLVIQCLPQARREVLTAVVRHWCELAGQDEIAEVFVRVLGAVAAMAAVMRGTEFGR